MSLEGCGHLRPVRRQGVWRNELPSLRRAALSAMTPGVLTPRRPPTDQGRRPLWDLDPLAT